jgi:hypothetical protein
MVFPANVPPTEATATTCGAAWAAVTVATVPTARRERNKEVLRVCMLTLILLKFPLI